MMLLIPQLITMGLLVTYVHYLRRIGRADRELWRQQHRFNQITHTELMKLNTGHTANKKRISEVQDSVTLLIAGTAVPFIPPTTIQADENINDWFRSAWARMRDNLPADAGTPVFDQLHETALSPRPYVAGPEELTHLDPELCNGPDCAMDRDHDGPCSLTPGDLSQIEDCPICGHTYGIHDVRKHEEADAAATNLVERLHAEQERIKGLPPVRIGDLSDDQVQAMISRHQDAVVAEMAEAAGAELADERPEL